MDTEVKNKVKEKIAQNRINEAIEIFKNALSKDSTDYNELVILIGGFNYINSKERKGVISISEYRVELNKIIDSFLNLLSNCDNIETKNERNNTRTNKLTDLTIITVSREDREDRYKKIAFDLYCDKEKIGEIAYQNEFSFSTEEGKMLLQIKYKFYKDEFDGIDAVDSVEYSGASEEIFFNIDKGKNKFKCGYKEYNVGLFGWPRNRNHKLYLTKENKIK